MNIQNSDETLTNSSPKLPGTQVIDTQAAEANRPTKKRVRLRIPKEFSGEPIISRLVSHHGLTVNISAALLGPNARDDGWFDLELRGTINQIQSGLIYLDEMDLELWGESNSEEDGW